MKIKNILVFHGRTGGDIDGDHFKYDLRDVAAGGIFFATSAEAASIYAEHSFCVESTPDEQEAFLESGAVIFPVRLSIANPATLDRATLFHIGRDIGIGSQSLSKFADDFEDSLPAERRQVFGWLKRHGYDGAYLPRDSMPEAPCGDLCLRESFVAFDPENQVVFALSAGAGQGCHWSLAQDIEQMDRAIQYGDESCDDLVQIAEPVPIKVASLRP